MNVVNRPSKEEVRAYTQRRNAAYRSAERPAPPTPEAIRRELGWQLIPSNDVQR